MNEYQENVTGYHCPVDNSGAVLEQGGTCPSPPGVLTEPPCESVTSEGVGILLPTPSGQLKFSFPQAKPAFWLTPVPLYKTLNNEFPFDFDPCPYPKPPGYNSLILPWGKMNFVNPPFRKVDGPYGGPTAFVKKAIEEKKKGNGSVLLLPVQSYVNTLLEAGASIRPLGRVKWVDGRTGQADKHPSTICIFIL